MNATNRLSVGVMAVVLSGAVVAADTETPEPQGIQVMPIAAVATISQIDARKRELADLEEQLKIVKTRGELSEAQSANERGHAGDALIEAMQRDLQGLPPAVTSTSSSEAVSAPASNSTPTWSIYSTGGYGGDMRAVLLNSQGQRVPVEVGSVLADGSRVVDIAHRTVKVRQNGKTQELPSAPREISSDAPPVRTYTPFERQAPAFGGGGDDATLGGL